MTVFLEVTLLDMPVIKRDALEVGFFIPYIYVLEASFDTLLFLVFFITKVDG